MLTHELVLCKYCFFMTLRAGNRAAKKLRDTLYTARQAFREIVYALVHSDVQKWGNDVKWRVLAVWMINFVFIWTRIPAKYGCNGERKGDDAFVSKWRKGIRLICNDITFS